MPKAFTEHEKQLIREQLLEQGYKQFAAHGLKKTSIDELAEAVGISKGAFYIFYESKEALFMDVVEEAEKRFREQVLAVIDLPGSSPRARLVAVLREAFTAWVQMPILQVFTRGDYDVLYRKIPVDKLQEHLASDRVFVEDLIARCNQAGIPIQAPIEQIDSLLHAIFFISLHQEDLAPYNYPNAMNLLMELTVSFCLGEVVVPAQPESE
ncbi:MAG: TetR/AcrR family transcriptional regulator [Anaerolineae bacterium]|nr:TetR/AcrR family transcriptional regulator [Anaerolineae bacterium]